MALGWETKCISYSLLVDHLYYIMVTRPCSLYVIFELGFTLPAVHSCLF